MHMQISFKNAFNIAFETTKPFLTTQLAEKTKRIAGLAAVCFGLLAAYYVTIHFYHQISKIVVQKQPTFSSKFQIAKRESLEKMIHDKELDYEHAESIKICFNVIHDNQQVEKSYIFSFINSHLKRDQIEDQVRAQFNTLFNTLQHDIAFNQSEEIKWRFGIWLKTINSSGKSVFSVHAGGVNTLEDDTIKFHHGFYQQGMLRSRKNGPFSILEQEFCEKGMEMPYSPQVDDFDNFTD